jgi:hypothetical protein
MGKSSGWNRRKFLIAGVAAGAVASNIINAETEPWQKASQTSEKSAAELTEGGIRPLLFSNTARPLRYTPDGADFSIRNGTQFFNRPIYGPNNSFRVDAGDRPEFSLYLPGHGGNLRLGLIAVPDSRWLFDCSEVVARYRPGCMVYDIRDPMLKDGLLKAELLTQGAGSGLMLRVQGHRLPAGIGLILAFGGVSGRKGERGGDIGCEVEPVSEFFQVRPEECRGNEFELHGSSAQLKSSVAEMDLHFPSGAKLRVCDGNKWYSKPVELLAGGATTLQVLTGVIPLVSRKELFFTLTVMQAGETHATPECPSQFRKRSEAVSAIAGSIRTKTPDPFIDACAGAMAVAADALWQADLGCLMHGDVAWRVPLAGWRGPYALDALGNHARMQQNILHWVARQNTSPVQSSQTVKGPADPGTHLTRKEHLLHSNGDVSNHHYDMNLVFFDGFLRHLRWTGDMEFARKIWPALERHLAWERRLFRRTFKGSRDDTLPLYEAYACIWASDNLQYNGGGVAHSSAYNFFSHKEAAAIGSALGNDVSGYAAEAASILRGMNELLWLRGQGAFAKAKDILTDQKVYTSPALWTMYHTIDSEVADLRQAWQMAEERLASLKKVPVQGYGVPLDGGYMLSCSEWMPYEWSLNLLVLAENMHTALALWQAGMVNEAFSLFKGNILDSMYQGLCPGNFHMSSELDPHRHESQRDFGDPIGISSRALVEGLFGVRPNVWRGELEIRPGFPPEWNEASLDHPDLSLIWRRAVPRASNASEEFKVISRFRKTVSLTMRLPARTTKLPAVTCCGKRVDCSFDAEAVGRPMVIIRLPKAQVWEVKIGWDGEPPMKIPEQRTYQLGDELRLPQGITLGQLADPQDCLSGGRVTAPGHHVVFAEISEGDCKWALPIAFTVRGDKEEIPHRIAGSVPLQPEMVDLTAHLKNRVADIFNRAYVSPRSPYCSLAVPRQGIGGWADFKTDPHIDDSGLRALGGVLQTSFAVPFRTAAGAKDPNCLFVSQWDQDPDSIEIPLKGRARALYLMMAGTTLPQVSRMENGLVTVRYVNGAGSTLKLNNPETWWPIEQDYLVDDFLFVDRGPLPARVDLQTAQVRVLTRERFAGKGRAVPGGAATILRMDLDGGKPLQSLRVKASVYGVVIGLMAVTLLRQT